MSEASDLIDDARMNGSGDGWKGTSVAFGYEALCKAVQKLLDERNQLRTEVARQHQRAEEVYKVLQVAGLDLLAPDARAVVHMRVTAQVTEKMSKRDTQRVKVIPREEV